MGVDAINNPGELEQLLDLLTENGSIADEFWIAPSEETSHAYEPLPRVAEKCERFKREAAAVRARGIRVGINVWPAFGAEGPNKIEGEPELPFQPMVGYDGASARRLACPVSPEFLEYTRARFRLYAQTGCDFIWVDDDCRFTHLGGPAYPCFCPRCVAGFENGRFASREALVAALNAPENGALRRKWSAYGAERLARYCRTVRETVDAVDPAIETSFMSVGYSHTSFSGDYIQKCMEALRADAARPGHGFYWDHAPMGMFEKAYEMARQIPDMPRRESIAIHYEEESCPHTPLKKAAGTRILEMALSVWGGCSGVAMNHIYHAGGKTPFAGLAPEAALLRKTRPFFDRYVSFASGLPQTGVWAVFSPWAASGMRVGDRGWFHENDRAYDANQFVKSWPVYGIPVTADPAAAHAALLQGSIPDLFSDAELERLFTKPVFLDGQALEALEGRGFCGRCGARVAAKREGGEELAETAYAGPFSGARRPTLCSQNYTLTPLSDETQTLAYITRPYGRPKEICATLYRDTAVLGFDPYDYVGTPGFLHMLRALDRAFGAQVWLQPENDYLPPRVAVFARADAQRAAVLLVNAETSPCAPFSVCFAGGAAQASVLGPYRAEQPAGLRRGDGCVFADVPELAPWETALVLFF